MKPTLCSMAGGLLADAEKTAAAIERLRSLSGDLAMLTEGYTEPGVCLDLSLAHFTAAKESLVTLAEAIIRCYNNRVKDCQERAG